MFASRTRPCLQYHIKRCTAPCVGYVSKEDYAGQAGQARDFLAGESRRIVDDFARAMQDASDRRDYEEAAFYRDRVQALAHIQMQQDINISGLGDADVFAVAKKQGLACVQVFFFRAGQNFGNKSYFPRIAEDDSEAAILGAFLPQFYGSRPPPKNVVVSTMPQEARLIAEALGEAHDTPYAVAIAAPQRGDRKRIVDFVARNAEKALARHVNERAGDAAGLKRVQEIFGLDEPPRRIEVYDNSHVQGTNRVGAMIVAGPDGFRKNAYRKFNIRTTMLGDDLAMMREVMTRRFSKGLEAGQQGDPEHWPDLVLIDGGVGQLNAAFESLDQMANIADTLNVVAISKGPDRNAGREFFHRKGQAPFQLPANDAGLLYLQRLRDEAHRFAINAHRAKRGKAMVASSLDEIPNIGPSRKKALLAHFGSGKAVERAGLADLEAVAGISRAVARKIYDHFQGS